jgi:hypothetical protein
MNMNMRFKVFRVEAVVYGDSSARNEKREDRATVTIGNTISAPPDLGHSG